MIIPIITLCFQMLSASTPQGRVSLELPEGWRQLDLPETRDLKPHLRHDNKWLERVDKEPPANVPLIAIKHDFPSDTIAASAQFFVSRLPKNLHAASSIEAARVVAAGALIAFHGKYEVEPREIRVAGQSGAEWIIRYDLVEISGAKHDMKTHTVVIVRDDVMYLLGCAIPSADTADLEAFNRVVASLMFSK